MSSSTHISLAPNQPKLGEVGVSGGYSHQASFARPFQQLPDNDESPLRRSLPTRAQNSRFDFRRRRARVGRPIPRNPLRQGPGQVFQPRGSRPSWPGAGLLKVWVRMTSPPPQLGADHAPCLDYFWFSFFYLLGNFADSEMAALDVRKFRSTWDIFSVYPQSTNFRQSLKMSLNALTWKLQRRRKLFGWTRPGCQFWSGFMVRTREGHARSAHLA